MPQLGALEMGPGVGVKTEIELETSNWRATMHPSKKLSRLTRNGPLTHSRSSCLSQTLHILLVVKNSVHLSLLILEID